METIVHFQSFVLILSYLLISLFVFTYGPFLTCSRISLYGPDQSLNMLCTLQQTKSATVCALSAVVPYVLSCLTPLRSFVHYAPLCIRALRAFVPYVHLHLSCLDIYATHLHALHALFSCLTHTPLTVMDSL